MDTRSKTDEGLGKRKLPFASTAPMQFKFGNRRFKLCCLRIYVQIRTRIIAAVGCRCLACVSPEGTLPILNISGKVRKSKCSINLPIFKLTVTVASVIRELHVLCLIAAYINYII